MGLGVIGLCMHLVGLCRFSCLPLEELPFFFPLWMRASATSSLNSLSFLCFCTPMLLASWRYSSHPWHRHHRWELAGVWYKAIIISARSTTPMWTLYCDTIFGQKTATLPLSSLEKRLSSLRGLIAAQELAKVTTLLSDHNSHFCHIIHAAVIAAPSLPQQSMVILKCASFKPVLADGPQTLQTEGLLQIHNEWEGGEKIV